MALRATLSGGDHADGQILNALLPWLEGDAGRNARNGVSGVRGVRVDEPVDVHTGRKTRSIFDRYDIVSGGDLRTAGAPLGNLTGTIQRQSEPLPRSGESR